MVGTNCRSPLKALVFGNGIQDVASVNLCVAYEIYGVWAKYKKNETCLKRQMMFDNKHERNLREFTVIYWNHIMFFFMPSNAILGYPNSSHRDTVKRGKWWPWRFEEGSNNLPEKLMNVHVHVIHDVI